MGKAKQFNRKMIIILTKILIFNNNLNKIMEKQYKIMKIIYSNSNGMISAKFKKKIMIFRNIFKIKMIFLILQPLLLIPIIIKLLNFSLMILEILFSLINSNNN
jgi:hypothetical protein